MTAAIETAVNAILQADPVCGGRVTMGSIRALAQLFDRPVVEVGTVLAERQACLKVMRACRDRIAAACDHDVEGVLELEARRLGQAIAGVEQGLHVDHTFVEQETGRGPQD